jgi:glycosyltransferase involved in cell wall biosynthesis
VNVAVNVAGSAAVNDVHFVVPDGIDDPTLPSGGNAYDRRVSRGLGALGWTVHEHGVPGSWPSPDDAARAELTRVVAGIPDGAVVLVDGLVASAVPDVLVPEARRLRQVVLVHLPLGAVSDTRTRERAVLNAAAAVVTTSRWTKAWLVEHYGLWPGRLHVVEPGVEPAQPAPGTVGGGELLCVAAVVPDKGHDVLLTALAAVRDLPWRLVCVGTLAIDEDFVQRLSKQAWEHGIGVRVQLAGPLTGTHLESAYAAADALVLASRGETFGMVVTEALAHGLPVVATTVGGLPDTLGRTADGSRPGLLVPPGDPDALAAALRTWLTEPDLRHRLRRAARERRTTLSGWSETADRLSGVLTGVAR